MREEIDEVRNNFLGTVSHVEGVLEDINKSMGRLSESLHKTQINIVEEVATLSERISKIEVLLNGKR